MFQILVHQKLTREDILREHATNHHLGLDKKIKCDAKHPCAKPDPDPFDVQVVGKEGGCALCYPLSSYLPDKQGCDVQVRGTFGGDYGPETYNVGDIWGGRQI